MIIVALGCAVSASAVAQDVAVGEKTFVVCRACHQIGPNAKNFVGPVLNGVVGRPAGTYPGSTTRPPTRPPASPGMRRLAEIPRQSAAGGEGNQDDLPGIKDPAKVKDVIAFLKPTRPTVPARSSRSGQPAEDRHTGTGL